MGHSGSHLKLGDTLCNKIIFLYSFFEYDSTAQIYVIGKSIPLNHAKRRKTSWISLEYNWIQLLKKAKSIMLEKAMLIMFKAAENKTILDKVCYSKILKLVLESM